MICLILSFLITFIFYFPIFNGFFQQDEWNGFSEYIIRAGLPFIDLIKYFFTPYILHFTPFTIAILYILLSIFGMNYLPYAVISFILHLIVIFLVYRLLLEIFSSRVKAGLGTLIFSSFASMHQATSWVMADIGTHTATIMGMLSATYFFKFLKENKTSCRYLNLSLIFLFASLFFKEITIGLFAIYLYLVWRERSGKIKDKLPFYKKVIFTGFIYLLIRTLMIPFVDTVAGESSTVFETKSVVLIAYDFISISVKSISQSIIPIQIIRSFSEFIAGLFPISSRGEMGTPDYEIFVVKRVMEAVSLLLSFIIGVFVLIKSKKLKIIVWGLVWIVVNSFIFAFSPGRSGITSVIDSRNLYFVGIGSAIVLASIYFQISSKFNKVLFLLLVLVPNLYFLRINIKDFVDVSNLRKSVLTRINVLFSDLPDRVVIYTQSSQSYYGLPEKIKIMPFQSGFGQTLLTLYYPKEDFPKDFFKERFLWEIDSQGYKEFEDRGFGYFRDLPLLKESVKQYNLPEESILAVSWDGKRNVLLDITEEVRSKIND